MSGTRGVTVKERLSLQPLTAAQRVTVTVYCASGFSSPPVQKEDVYKMTFFRVTVGNNLALVFMKRKTGGKTLKMYYPKTLW